MNIHILAVAILWLLGNSVVPDLFAEENPVLFRPSVLWENNINKGVLLVSPTEMWVIDSKGQKTGKVISREVVKRVYISPDAKKLAYTTTSGVWLAKLDTGETSQIASGDCNFLRWDLDSMSLMFSMDYYASDNAPDGDKTKLFWADGDGKNLKQVYP